MIIISSNYYTWSLILCDCFFPCIVPPFNVTISQSYYDSLYTGTNLTISCDIALSSLVNIPVLITNEWTRNGSQISENTITEDLVKFNSLNFAARLEFFPLNSLTDDGEYQCSVKVNPNVQNEIVYITSIENDTSISLDVLG